MSDNVYPRMRVGYWFPGSCSDNNTDDQFPILIGMLNRSGYSLDLAYVIVSSCFFVLYRRLVIQKCITNATLNAGHNRACYRHIEKHNSIIEVTFLFFISI